jgi:hypothetical protein
MAVIRCQSCGKPNPDFLEVCQYCDARLKPLEASAAPEAAAPAAEKPGIMRCPACGKPNPIFLENCQFCDARLKPLEASAAPEAAAPAAEKPGIMRCPACGKPNPIFLENCQFCDARLKPLGPGEPAPPAAEPLDTLDRLRAIVPPEPESETFRPTPKQAEPDWLWTGAPAEEEAQPAAEDWMSSLRGAAAQPAPAEEAPDWLKPALSTAEGPAPGEAPPAAPAEEIPDWLKPAPSTAEGAMPAEEVPDWLKPTPSTAEGAMPAEEVPDWLKPALSTAEGPAPGEAPPAAPAEEIPDWLKPAPSTAEGAMPGAEAIPPVPPVSAFAAEPASPAEEVPDWLKPALPLGGASRSTAEGPTRGEEAAPAEEVPDWLRTASSTAEGGAPGPEAAPPAPSPFAAEAETPAEEVPDWLKSMQAPSAEELAQPAAPAPSPFAPEPAGEEPDWLRSLRGAETTAPPAAIAPEPAGEEPDWLQSLRGAGAAAPPTEPAPAAIAPEPGEAEPDWLKALGAPTAEIPAAAPAVSPFADESFVSPFTDQPPEKPTLDTATGPMPDWLAAMRPGDLSEALAEIAPQPGAPAAPGGPALIGEGMEGLEQTALPSWLEAMRPVEVGKAQIPPETDAYQESVGVLAGMRGVLRAEPAVAIPHKSTTQVHQLEVSELHAGQAQLLTRLLAEEAEARPEVKRRARLALPLERWLVFGLMAVALLLPLSLGSGLFPLPATIGLDTRATYDIVEQLPASKPALVAFDYDPGQAGELDPAATALVAHLMHRGVPVVGVSTRLAGAAVGDALLREVAADLQTNRGVSYTYGTHYLNLGYIPGGPVGLLQFAARPRALFERDFEGASRVWEQPVMNGVNGLGDFGLIVLVTATPDSARAWVEQTRNFAADVKMIAAVSAGADPLVRPYYEASPPQIAGMISGLRGAAQYEQQAGLPGAASNRWDVLGSGLMGAAAIIVVGNLVNAALGLLRRGKK